MENATQQIILGNNRKIISEFWTQLEAWQLQGLLGSQMFSKENAESIKAHTQKFPANINSFNICSSGYEAATLE